MFVCSFYRKVNAGSRFYGVRMMTKRKEKNSFFFFIFYPPLSLSLSHWIFGFLKTFIHSLFLPLSNSSFFLLEFSSPTTSSYYSSLFLLFLSLILSPILPPLSLSHVSSEYLLINLSFLLSFFITLFLFIFTPPSLSRFLWISFYQTSRFFSLL